MTFCRKKVNKIPYILLTRKTILYLLYRKTYKKSVQLIRLYIIKW